MKKFLLCVLALFLFGTQVSQAAITVADDEPGERLIVTGTCADGDAAEAIKTGTFYIEAILWQVPTTTDHDLDLEDGSGDVVFQVKCVVADQTLVFYPRTMVRGGLYADQLDSGSVVIYYRTKRPKGLE